MAAVSTPAPVVHDHSEDLPGAVSIAVLADPGNDEQLARHAAQIAHELSLPVARSPSTPYDFLLAATPDRLELRPMVGPRSRPVYVDLNRLDTVSPAGRSRRQPIAKAVAARGASGRSRLHVVDATAGFGEDAWLLASLGYRVTAIERCAIIAALLRDGLRRARLAAPSVAERITLIAGDARDVLSQIQPPADVVYLDPMFPAKRKSALGRKPIRVLRRLVGDDADAAELFGIARQAAVRRIVVKRPLHAPPLSGVPAVRHKAKSMCYDIYPNPCPGVR